MNVTEDESILYCALSDIVLISALANNNLLESKFYKNLTWPTNEQNVRVVKEVLSKVNLGNPAMLQMNYYALLVLPKELLDQEYEDFCKDEFNNFYAGIVDNVTTNYPNESGSNLLSVNYYRHIRNSISHASCEYFERDGKHYVKFKDKDDRRNYTCEINMLTINAGKGIDFLALKMMEFINRRISSRT